MRAGFADLSSLISIPPHDRSPLPCPALCFNSGVREARLSPTTREPLSLSSASSVASVGQSSGQGDGRCSHRISPLVCDRDRRSRSRVWRATRRVGASLAAFEGLRAVGEPMALSTLWRLSCALLNTRRSVRRVRARDHWRTCTWPVRDGQTASHKLIFFEGEGRPDEAAKSQNPLFQYAVLCCSVIFPKTAESCFCRFLNFD